MSNLTKFRLPKDGAIYTESIFSRCRDLIGYNIWSGIEQNRLDRWIANFSTPEEKYFAARILDILIYRSSHQTVALMRQLFQRVIPDLARRKGLALSLRNIYQSLKVDSVDPGIRIVPVIPPDASPGKSASTIVRILKRNLRFSEHWNVYPQQVPALLGQVDTVVFVDDFLGTGTQFLDFLSDTGLKNHLSTGSFIYAPLAGHIEGIKNLKNTHPDLHVGVVELLDDKHALFHEESGSFPDDVNSVEVARDFYYKLLKDRKIEIAGPDRRGFGHFELAYAFENAIPDNSLPLLWWHDSEDWQSLFDR